MISVFSSARRSAARSWMPRAVAGAGATVLATGVLAVGVPSASPTYAPAAAAPPVLLASPADDGVLGWGVKDSFRNYVEGPIADGEITVVPPATRNDDGTFRFPDGAGDVDPEAGTASVAFGGGVTFWGHGGTLDMRLTDLRLEVAGSAGVVVLDLESSGVLTPDLELVTVDLSGQTLQPDPDGVVTITDAATVITEAGAAAFGEFYEAGTPFDPLSMTITVEGGPTESPTTTPPTSTPPTSNPPTSTPPTTTVTSTVPPPPPPPDPTATWEAGQVSSGLVDWGVKESFRGYIAGPIADGGWTLIGDVEERAGGIFRWTASFGDFDMDSESGSVGFVGGVRFTGHEGGLDITLSRPRVRFDGDDTAVLVLDVRTKSLDGEDYVEEANVDFATLDLAAGSSDVGTDTVGYAGVPAVLTAAGAEGFGGFYTEGTELDPVTISFAVGGAEVPGGGSAGGPGLPGTGADDLVRLGGAAALIVVLGTGLLFAARRVRAVAR